MPPADTDCGSAPALSAAQLAALAMIRAYKVLFSPMYRGSCRFLPSCSDYAAQAVVAFGVLRGSLLAARRLARCHPLGGHGLDPCPWTLASSVSEKKGEPAPVRPASPAENGRRSTATRAQRACQEPVDDSHGALVK